ncbi:MAG: cation diffusion facilitator family transporter [Polyangiaceae bacterium]|nr:cation diffusion facilitator family transporter [Polyangiaceae bacterium]
MTAPPHHPLHHPSTADAAARPQGESGTSGASHSDHHHDHSDHHHGHSDHHHDHSDHHHDHSDHHHDHKSAPRQALQRAFALTATFMLAEMAVGWWSGSLALLADSVHMLSDSGALGLALFAQHWASKPRTAKTTFGFHRTEVLAAFVNGVTLAFTSVWIVKEAVDRWLHPAEIHGPAMLVTATLGLAVNILAAFILMRAQRDSMNVRAAFAHVVTDAVGSVGAMVAGICIVFFGLYRADPLLSVLIAGLVAYSGWRVLRETTAILLEGAPPHLDVGKIARSILACPGVNEVHDLHVWRISDRFDVLTVHVTLTRGAHGTDVCRNVSLHLKAAYGLDHVTVQPEAPPPDQLVHVRASRDGQPLGKRL